MCDWSLQSAHTIKKQGRKDRKRHVDAENGTFSCASKKSFLKEFVQRVSHRWKRLNATDNTCVPTDKIRQSAISQQRRAGSKLVLGLCTETK
jgi:hypothetical protein